MKDLSLIDVGRLEISINERLRSIKKSFNINYNFDGKQATAEFMAFLNKFSDTAINDYLTLLEDKAEKSRVVTKDVKPLGSVEEERYFIMALDAMRVCGHKDCLLVNSEVFTKEQALDKYANPQVDELKKSDFEEDEEELPSIEEIYDL